MTRLSLALTLLFIAPAWGSDRTITLRPPTAENRGPPWPNCVTVEYAVVGEPASIIGDGLPPDLKLNPDETLHLKWVGSIWHIVPTCEEIINSTGTFTPPPSCEPGWTIVLDTSQKPKCAWVLKEPSYK